MYRTNFLAASLLLSLLLFSPLYGQEAKIEDILWKGSDFIIQFSDSLDYEVDLVETDSANLVIRLSAPLATAERSDKGPNGLKATLSRGESGDVRVLTIQGEKRFGYSTLWRPYTHRLVVHTFPDWTKLSFTEGEYHRGLNALELGQADVAQRYLSQVIATDSSGALARQASSVLGLIYAAEGKDSLARIYLTPPLGPDDYMALAGIARRAGDTAEAAKNEALFADNLKGYPESTGGNVPPTDPEPNQTESRADNDGDVGTLLKSWKGLLLIGLIALVVIGLAVWFARKPEPERKRPEEAKPQENRTPETTTGTSESPTTTVAAEPPPGSETHIPSGTALPESELPSPREEVHPEYITQPESVSRTPSGERTSAQAEQLRRRMTSTPGESPGERKAEQNVRADEGDDESTISEARKLNVSRDYVELRNRIAALRQKIDDKS